MSASCDKGCGAEAGHRLRLVTFLINKKLVSMETPPTPALQNLQLTGMGFLPLLRLPQETVESRADTVLLGMLSEIV
jgi:hypothetical protein